MRKLNLGCDAVNLLPPPWVNVDICPLPVETDWKGFNFEVVDLSCPKYKARYSRTTGKTRILRQWPWPDNSVEEIRAYDIIEHLPDKILTMNEIWRVLEPEGVVDIFVPTTDGRGAWCDPQHVSYWNRASFWYYTVGVAEYERLHVAYGISGGFVVVSEEQKTWPGEVVKLRIVLRKVT